MVQSLNGNFPRICAVFPSQFVHKSVMENWSSPLSLMAVDGLDFRNAARAVLLTNFSNIPRKSTFCTQIRKLCPGLLNVSLDELYQEPGTMKRMKIYYNSEICLKANNKSVFIKIIYFFFFTGSSQKCIKCVETGNRNIYK
jgi:hypothetical protein